MNIARTIIIGLLIVAGIVGLAVYDRHHRERMAVEPYGTQSVSPLVSTTASASQSTVSTTKNNMHEVTISTSYGDIVFQTYDADAPRTVANFVLLANKKFYNGVIFHRVIKGFMIQGGDPTGTGTSGPGYQFADELDPKTESYQKGYVSGTVAMANSGPNTNGSQFFIMHGDVPLQHDYTIFGHVIRGQDVVDKIASDPTTGAERSTPVSPVTMTSVTVVELK